MADEMLMAMYINFKAIFNDVFKNTPVNYPKFAMEVPSTSRMNAYAWLSSFPKLREWLGDRVVKHLESAGFTIENKKFEATIAVKREDLEDDQLGIYKPLVQELARAAKAHPDELVAALLEGGFSQACYDGKMFFDSHKVGKKTYTNKSTAALSADAYAAARAAMMGIKNEEGRPLGIMPNLLIVPPALEGTGRQILQAKIIDGSDNPWQGTADLLVLPYLTSTTAWYLLDTSRAIKPLIVQTRKKPQLVALDRENDENVFKRGEFLYGVDWRGNAGYGLWQLAYGSTGA